MNLLQNFVNSIEASQQAAAFSAAGADSAAFMRTSGFELPAGYTNQPASVASATAASFPGCFYLEKLKGFEMSSVGPGRMTDEAHHQSTLGPTSSAHGVTKAQSRQRVDESKSDVYEARETASGYGEMMNAASAAAVMLANSEQNKRMRNMFSMSQIDVLERIFEQTHYPDSAIREQLSKSLNLSVVRIQVWFQNRRAKFRKLDSLPRGSSNSKVLNRKQHASSLDPAGFRSESKSTKESLRAPGSGLVENKHSDAFSAGPLHLDFGQTSYQTPGESLSAAELLSSMTAGRSSALFGSYFGAGGLYQHQTRPLTVHADAAGQQFGAHFDQQTPYAAFHHHHHNHGHQTQLQFDQTNDCHN